MPWPMGAAPHISPISPLDLPRWASTSPPPRASSSSWPTRRLGEIWGDMGEIWGDMGRYGEIWASYGRVMGEQLIVADAEVLTLTLTLSLPLPLSLSLTLTLILTRRACVGRKARTTPWSSTAWSPHISPISPRIPNRNPIPNPNPNPKPSPSQVSGIIPPSCRSEALLSSRLTPTLTLPLPLPLTLTLTLTLAQTVPLALALSPRPSSRAPPPSLHRVASSRSSCGRTNATGCVRRS